MRLYEKLVYVISITDQRVMEERSGLIKRELSLSLVAKEIRLLSARDPIKVN